MLSLVHAKHGANVMDHFLNVKEWDVLEPSVMFNLSPSFFACERFPNLKDCVHTPEEMVGLGL